MCSLPFLLAESATSSMLQVRSSLVMSEKLKEKKLLSGAALKIQRGPLIKILLLQFNQKKTWKKVILKSLLWTHWKSLAYKMNYKWLMLSILIKIILGFIHLRIMVLQSQERLLIYLSMMNYQSQFWKKFFSKLKFMPECLQTIKQSLLNSFKIFVRLKLECAVTEQTIVVLLKLQIWDFHCLRLRLLLLLLSLVRFKIYRQ